MPFPETPTSLLMMALRSSCLGEALDSHGLRIGGWVDGGYTYASSGPGRQSVEPIPNRFNDEFTLNQFELHIEKPPDPEELSWGFVIRTWAGGDAALLRPVRGAIVPNPNPRFGFDVYTALIQAHLPILTDGGVDIEAGQRYPLLGYEPALSPLRHFYSNDYQFFYGLPGLFTGVIVTAHVNERLDLVNAVTLGTPTFFTLLSDAPSYVGRFDYWLEETKATKVSLGLVIGPYHPHSSALSTTEVVTVSRDWHQYLTQAVQFYAGYSQEGIFVPGLERAYGLYNIFIRHLNPQVDLNFRTEWYDDVDGRSYPGGTGFKTNYEALTVAVDYHPTTWLQFRPELRGDFANNARALGPVGGRLYHSQLTAAMDFLIKF